MTKSNEYNIALFEERFAQTQLHQVINFTVMHNPKLKSNPLGLCGKVYKTSDLVKQAVQDDYSGMPDFIVVINEDVFDRLDTEHQKIVADKLFATMGFDFEKSTTMLINPDVQEFSGILKQHDYALLEALKLNVESIYQQLEEENDDKPKKNKKKELLKSRGSFS